MTEKCSQFPVGTPPRVLWSRGRGKKTEPNPTDRCCPGSKRRHLTNAQGVPLSILLTQNDRHDVTQMLPLLDNILPIADRPGHALDAGRRWSKPTAAMTPIPIATPWPNTGSTPRSRAATLVAPGAWTRPVGWLISPSHGCISCAALGYTTSSTRNSTSRS